MEDTPLVRCGDTSVYLASVGWCARDSTLFVKIGTGRSSTWDTCLGRCSDALWTRLVPRAEEVCLRVCTSRVSAGVLSQNKNTSSF